MKSKQHSLFKSCSKIFLKWIREAIPKWKKKKWDYVESLSNKSKKIKNKKAQGGRRKEKVWKQTRKNRLIHRH